MLYRNKGPVVSAGQPEKDLAEAVRLAATAASEIGRRQLARAGIVVAAIGGIAVAALILAAAALWIVADR